MLDAGSRSPRRPAGPGSGTSSRSSRTGSPAGHAEEQRLVRRAGAAPEVRLPARCQEAVCDVRDQPVGAVDGDGEDCVGQVPAAGHDGRCALGAPAAVGGRHGAGAGQAAAGGVEVLQERAGAVDSDGEGEWVELSSGSPRRMPWAAASRPVMPERVGKRSVSRSVKVLCSPQLCSGPASRSTMPVMLPRDSSAAPTALSDERGEGGDAVAEAAGGLVGDGSRGRAR